LDTPERSPAEEREWVIWGAPCRLCGFIICECPEYRLLEGGMLERRKRALRLEAIHDNLLAFDGSTRGLRMRFEDIKGVCPSCGQGPAGMVATVEGPGVPEAVRVRCNNNHWATLDAWNRTTASPKPQEPGVPHAPPPLSRAQIPTTPREAGEITAAATMEKHDPRPPETATMIQNPEPEVDPLAPITFTLQVGVSRSALKLLEADWNPDKNAAVGRMRQYVAGLITQAETLRRKAGPQEMTDVPGPARHFTLAITHLEQAAMFLEKGMRGIHER